ncbi:MAG: amidohydrolase family protein [Pseudomonadota bacterium]
MSGSSEKRKADFAIVDAIVISMDDERRVFNHGALAVKGSRIVWVGPAAEIDDHVEVSQRFDGRGMVITPGFINSHVHITGDPLTRHYMPDDINDPDKLFSWVIPRYFAHTEQDEELSATYAAIELLKSGTTTFVGAGTIRHLDHAVAGLAKTGIRARVGAWIEGRAFEDPSQEPQLIDRAIAALHAETETYPSTDEALIAAWPILVGHNTNPDDVWRAALRLAEEKDLRVTAHMSPYTADPDWYLEHVGRRPVQHLRDIGVLGPKVLLTHMTHLDEAEVRAVVETDTRVIFCPFATLKGAFGASFSGRYTELLQAGVKMAFATDGYDCEILPATRIGSALFKDITGDTATLPALAALEKITCEAAAALGLERDIGSLEVGKNADFICFDTNNVQWRPLLSPLDQLVWSADARSISSVWVNGVCVVKDQQSALLDEEALLAEVQRAAERIISSSKLPFERSWTTV